MEEKLYLLALKYLTIRPRSEKEVQDYLEKKAKQFPDGNNSLIDVIILKLKRQKFLNDREFAKIWVRSRTEYKPKGKWLVKMELKQKGISPDVIDEILENRDLRALSEVGLAVELLEKKRKKYESMDRQERFTKAGSMLARRGFDLDSIKAAIDQVFGKMV